MFFSDQKSKIFSTAFFFDINTLMSRGLSDSVSSFYDKNTSEFSSTRYKKWPSISLFLKNIQKEDVYLDLGCGNGRHLIFDVDCKRIGIDLCLGFLKEIKRKDENGKNKELALIQSKVNEIPLQSNSITYLLCSAVIHHVIDPVPGILEISRVMAPLSLGLVVVWGSECLKNKEIREIAEVIQQNGQENEILNKIIEKQEVARKTHKNSTDFHNLIEEIGVLIDDYIQEEKSKPHLQEIKPLYKSRYIRIFEDHMLINWKNTGEMRYYKFYTVSELRDLVESADLEVLKIEAENESLNCYIRKK